MVRPLLLTVLLALPLAALDASLTLDLRGVNGPTASLHAPGRSKNTFTLPVLHHRRSGDAWFEGEWRLDALLAALAADRVEFLNIALIAPPGGKEELITGVVPVGPRENAGKDVTHWGRVAVKTDARHTIRYAFGWRTLPWGIWAWLAMPLIMVWCMLHPAGWLWQTAAVSAALACAGQTEAWQALRFLGHVPTVAGSLLGPAMGAAHGFLLIVMVGSGMLGATFDRGQLLVPLLAFLFRPTPYPRAGGVLSWDLLTFAVFLLGTGGIALWSILRQPREKNPTRLPELERAIEARTRESVTLIAVDDRARRPSGHDHATPIPRSWTERMTIPELEAMTRLLRHNSMAEMAVMFGVPVMLVAWGEPRAFFLAPWALLLAIPARRWSYAKLLRELARTDTAALLSGLDKARTAFPRSYDWMYRSAAKIAAPE